MAILKCKMCGGDIELSQDKTFGTCEFCGSIMTFPKVDDEQRAAMFNRGNHFRRIGEFDKALAVYERIVQEDENDAEAHWCCALCRFGIEYVEDPNTLEYLPTCHRASFDSFLEDPDYLAALEHSDGITRRQYQKDAAKIAEVQRGILATSQNEEPFDVFICYKETEEDGSRTRDSLYAQDIYYQLTEQGRRVFFSRITLEDKAGTEYEPYIFAALNSAKVMVLVTTSAEHASAVWVKNEWSRFLSLMRKDRSKLLLPCYRDMDPYDLPEALSVLQSYDMSKIGFIQDLTRGINKVLDGAKPKQTAKETVVIQQQSGYAAPLLERAFISLEDGDWAKADEFCEQVLNLEPKNALAYLGKLMAELKVCKREQLKDQPQPFDDRNSYQKAFRFGDEKLKEELSGDITTIHERNEYARLTGIYNAAVKAMDTAVSEADYQSAASTFEQISSFKDARSRMLECHRIIGELKAKEELDKKEAARKAEEDRIASKKRNRIIAIISIIIIVCIVLVSVLTKVIIPNHRYNEATQLYHSGKYEEAITAFEAIKGYKDSAEQLAEAKYGFATELFNSGKYEQTISVLTTLNEYTDSESLLEKSYIGLYGEEKYNLINNIKYVENIRIGNTYKFGAYEQDNNTSNGKEDIEWIVLAKENNMILMISKYALDCQPFNASRDDNIWSSCSLRQWLNGTFLNNAFSSEDQTRIQNSTVKAEANPKYGTYAGATTKDKVFLLSITEVEQYFNSKTKSCQGTDYCFAQGARNDGNNQAEWWLRSPGCVSYFAAYVKNGSVKQDGWYVDYAHQIAVRPALWIDF